MKISHIITVSVFAALLAGTSSAASQADDFPSGAVCLSRTVSTIGGENRLSIIVRLESVAAMEAKGFSQLECAEAFGSRKEALVFRDWVCSSASIPNERAQGRYEQYLGERPAVLCGMAELVLGQWEKEAGR